MTFLILFSVFISTVFLAIVLERILQSPVLTAITIFSVYLIILTILFIAGIFTDFPILLLYAIVFAIIAFITAVIARFIRCICKKLLQECCGSCPRRTENTEDISETNTSSGQETNGNLLTISCRCNNGNSRDILSINSNCNESDQNNNPDCNCRNIGETINNRSPNS